MAFALTQVRSCEMSWPVVAPGIESRNTILPLQGLPSCSSKTSTRRYGSRVQFIVLFVASSVQCRHGPLRASPAPPVSREVTCLALLSNVFRLTHTFLKVAKPCFCLRGPPRPLQASRAPFYTSTALPICAQAFGSP